jgi:hypothetical protein
MDTGSEAKVSISSVIYYRGVSVTITKRDPDVTIRPLIEAQLKTIDWLLDEKGAKPSWNEDTNKQAKQTNQDVAPATAWQKPEQPLTPEQQAEMIITTCPIHNVQMKGYPNKFGGGMFYSHYLGKDGNGKSMYCKGK